MPSWPVKSSWGNKHYKNNYVIALSGSSVGKESASNVRDLFIAGWGRSPGEGNGNPLQYSCLENPMDRGAWQASVHGLQRIGHDLVTKPPLRYFSVTKEKHRVQ